jgi:hypothetical protein
MSGRSAHRVPKLFEPVAAVTLPHMPDLKEVPFGMGPDGRTRLRAENREVLQATVVALWPDAKIIAERLPQLRIEHLPMVEFSLAYHEQTGVLILRASSPQARGPVFGALISSDPQRGNRQEVNLDDFRAITRVRDALLEQHGAKLGVN